MLLQLSLLAGLVLGKGTEGVKGCVCTMDYTPVCGKNGKTYSNKCKADCFNVAVDYEGECGSEGKDGGDDACVCTMDYTPVCGVNGKTYGNACAAKCAKVRVASKGECKEGGGGGETGGSGKTCATGCKSWYDGCNNCTCRNGRVAACTRKFCFSKGEAKCMDKDDGGDGGADAGMKCPMDCKSWFDGCNDCTCHGGKVGACTKKMCFDKGEAKCMDKDDGGADAGMKCPMDCKSWFDGCNNCTCNGGKVGACTMKMCFDKGEAKCMDKDDGGADAAMKCPMNCKSWFDGCNNCTCENGKVGACTEMFCVSPGKPKCNDEKEERPSCDDEGYCCPEGASCMMPRGGKKKTCIQPNDGTVDAVECGDDSTGGDGMSCPKDCLSWYDGCNTCRCNAGKVAACTYMFCVTKNKPYCINSAPCQNLDKESCAARADCQAKGKKCKNAKKVKKVACSKLTSAELCNARSDCQAKTKGKKKKFKKCAKAKGKGGRRG